MDLRELMSRRKDWVYSDDHEKQDPRGFGTPGSLSEDEDHIEKDPLLWRGSVGSVIR